MTAPSSAVNNTSENVAARMRPTAPAHGTDNLSGKAAKLERVLLSRSGQRRGFMFE